MHKKNSHLKRTALVSALLIELTTAAQAANIAVDGTTCTLADAITAANTDAVAGGCTAGAGDDVLDLDIAGSPFTQTAAMPNLTSNITINGNGSIIERDAGAPEFPLIYIAGGSNAIINEATITGGSISPNNFGGGVVVRPGGSVQINDSIISGNNGGAVWLYNAAASSINNSVIENNTANPGQYYNGGVSINGGYLDINNSTITGNDNVAVAAGGGGLYVTDYSASVTVGVSNSTISNNSAVVDGGGIASIGFGNGIELNLNSVTVTQNSSQANGGGMANTGTDIAVSQSLLSGNTAVTANTWTAGGGSYVTVDAYNIFGESSASGLTGVTPGATDIVPTEDANGILEANLADNGGPTPTHALVPNGPAVDVIPGVSCLFSTDQTGKARPIDADGDGNADCDVGAYESLDIIFKNGFDG
ncbi:right-handed parallel beta-helix repeat-containing protein [Marinicella meishanensis]|uniref:right-handed parallel beta-helix repeat-containing protein n=1 Tax=Marinicella meishanensis TaxID=2873263 RepID=UPI001CBFF1DF|nr:right-handed parallel beta-helix repeat-containing protein [Marinicella sp. NBU2979]